MQPGDVVGERFVIDRFTAAGGMGAVYRAIDRHTDTLAAVKVMRGADAPGLERFAREARVLADLRHPAIVRYLAHGHTGDGNLYLAMEWLEGEDLATRLATTDLSFAESLQLVTQAAAALAVAHARQIVHRDVKPGNLFLADWNPQRLKLLDFGVARVTRLAGLTATGHLVGTPLYMSPEQARGVRDVDARADVFALGAVLFRCLTGRLPFVGETVGEIVAQLCSEVAAPRLRDLIPDAAPALDDLVARLLDKDRGRRPRDAAALLAELLPFEPTEQGGRARPRRDAISASERRIQFLVLIAAEPDAPLTAAAAAHGAELVRVDAGAAALLGGYGVATDLAQAATRLALALRALAPGAGVAVVTARGEGEEALARAARLATASPGPVRVDEATAGLLGARFHLAGDADGLAVTGERDPEHAVRSLLGRATPFVGRDRELTQLESIFDDCVESSAARAVLLTAAAGIGKSRLRQELVARIKRRGAPVEVWIGQGDPMRAGAPFALLGDAVRRAAGVNGSEPLPRRQALLAARIARHVPAARAPRVTEFIGELAGVPFSADDSPQLRAARRDAVLLAEQVRAAWEEWLAAECAAQPVVLVLEDLHWGDVPTVRLIGAALRALVERPFLVLAMARPEVHDLFPRLWAEHGRAELLLAALPRKATETLAWQALGEQAPAELIADVVARAGGNAFYLEELIRHVATGGAGMPESVLAMVAARIEALPVETRRVLRAASVFGEVFWDGAVKELLGSSQPVEPALAELVEREVVQRRLSPRFADQRELAFRHSLLREAAYAMLVDEDRRRGHRLAGRWLADAGEPDAFVVADHLDRGDDPGAAEQYARAAEQALQANDLDAALARAARSLASGAGSELGGKVRLLQVVVHRARGDVEATRRAGLDAVVALPHGSEAWCIAQGEVAAACGKQFEIDEIRRIVGELESTEGTPVTPQRATAFARAATQCFLAGEPELGDALMARVPMNAPLAGDPGVVAYVEETLGWRDFMRSALAPARDHMRRSAEAFEQTGDARNTCCQNLELAYIDHYLGDFESALERHRWLDEAARLGLVAVACYARSAIALTHLCFGDLAAARAAAEESLRRIEDVHAPRVVLCTHLSMGMLLAAEDRLDEAERHLRLAVAQGARAFPPICLALSQLAILRVRRGDAAEGLALATRAAAQLDPSREVCPHETEVRAAMAEAAMAAGAPLARASVAYAHERLLANAALIPDPETRRQFLERPPANARILDMARRLATV